MFPRYLVILLFESVFCSRIPWSSFTSSEQDDFSSLDLINTTSIIIGTLKKAKEIKLDQYLYSKDLENLFLKLESYSNNHKTPFEHSEKVLKLNVIGSEDSPPINAVRISHGARDKRKLLKPMFKLVAHDAVGYALMVSLMQYLVYSNGVDQRITEMLDNIDIWIVATVNPAGLSRSKEGRCDEEGGYCQNLIERMIQFDNEHPFVLSGVLKGGALVASYPSDYTEHEILIKLAKNYAARNPMMAPGRACNKSFPGGITNGVQDTNYTLTNCFEIALYLGCCKYPKRSELPAYWHANLASMLNFIESTRQGIYGLVTDKQEQVPLRDAVIIVEGKDKKMKVTEDGEYWRLLVPGVYNITATVLGYSIETQTVEVTENDPYVRKDFFPIRTGVRCRIELLDESLADIEKVKISVPVLEDGEEFINTYMVPLNEKHLIPLPLGHYTLTAKATGYILKTESAIVTEDNPQVELVFSLERPNVHVLVKNIRGKPLTKADVTVQTGKASNKFQLNENGECSLKLDVEKRYYVTASQFGYIRETKLVNLRENQTYLQICFVLKRIKLLQISCLT